MRVSTNTLYDQGVKSMLQQQHALFKTQQQISTGKRILTPADDPIGSARAHELSQAISINTQYAGNRGQAADSLKLLDHTLAGVTDLIQHVQSLAVTAGNAALSDSDRASIATELRGRFEELLGLANSADSEANFLFAGFQSKNQPFVQTAAGVQYVGDQGQRLVQVSSSRQMAVGETGQAVFERIRNGNGVFVTAADAGNSGSGVISPGAVTSPAGLTGDEYRIDFSDIGGVTSYTITNETTGAPVGAPVFIDIPFTSGDVIAFDGLQFEIRGMPAAGDKFHVKPSGHESLFQTMQNFINVLEIPASGPGNARLSNVLQNTMQNLGHALDNVLSARAAAGTRLQEIDALQQTGSAVTLQYQQSLSQLEDLDYAQAISDLMRRQTQLEAAQQSFARIANLSLFNVI
ncbi:flagellar hook-associated protein FlgL [Nitrosomonas halophila]|uniref:Flagellar hook-associated protein 3 FlgL n=1 Tax=Nitrosomonas halophila TaxID=44576 RepID=A0A1H3H5I7_9PROT|nr:flagellar hook-associated protein FlgL [Nitrosomonas halophila]SDY10843.1 flagellar hook-associated protein 3 FlgL [Nitrosomonas halophila]